MKRHGFCAEQGFDETVVLVPRQRDVQVVAHSIVVTRSAENDRFVDRVRVDRRRDGVVEIQILIAEGLREILGQIRIGQRAGRENDESGVGNPGDPLTPYLDSRMRFDCLGDSRREADAINRERLSGGHCRSVSDRHHQRPELTHFLFEKTDRVSQRIRAKGVTTDELSKIIRCMSGRSALRFHFVEHHIHATLGELPRRFASGKTGTDHDDFLDSTRPRLQHRTHLPTRRDPQISLSPDGQTRRAQPDTR